jgi:hypothetical protein
MNTHPTWRKSSVSGDNTQCVEVARAGLVRDSKNPAGPRLRVELAPMLTAIKAGHVDR